MDTEESTDMEEKRILEIAEEEGFVNASVIDTEDIVFIHGFREALRGKRLWKL